MSFKRWWGCLPKYERIGYKVMFTIALAIWTLVLIHRLGELR